MVDVNRDEFDFLRTELKSTQQEVLDWKRCVAMLLDLGLGGEFIFTEKALREYPTFRRLRTWSDPATNSITIKTIQLRTISKSS